MSLTVHRDLTTELAGQVADLIDVTRVQDGVSPVSEETTLRLHTSRPSRWLHLLYHAHGDLVGYAHLDNSDPKAPWAELLVGPLSRRAGVGSHLLREVLGLAPAVRVWAHGYLPVTAAFAMTRGMHVVRELWQMSRPLEGLPAGRALPEGFEVSTLTPGDERDETDWVATNAGAFADHPEQGRITRGDLQARMDEPWFDPAGFFLVRDARPGAGHSRLAAFHWTKVERGTGEVYVVGVHPDYQGHGLGSAATWIGLDHLRRLGLKTVTLYVDGENYAAIATYRRLGFERVSLDVQLAATAVSAAS